MHGPRVVCAACLLASAIQRVSALAATYRAAAFFRLSPMGACCSIAASGAPRRHDAVPPRISALARTTTRRVSEVARARALCAAGLCARETNRAGRVEQVRVPSRDPESLEMSHNSRADYGTERLPGQRFSLPSVQDCYDCANRCLNMWNDSVDHAARSSLLRMADAWLQLACESNNIHRTERPHGRDANRQPVVTADRPVALR
jgi:hypothetical protein